MKNNGGKYLKTPSLQDFLRVRSPRVIVIYITRKFESDFISTSPCTVMFRKKNYLWNINESIV